MSSNLQGICERRLGSLSPARLLKPGEISRADFGGNGQTVIGKVMLVGTNAPPDWQQGQPSIHTTLKLLEQLRQAKTPQERMAISQSPEYQAAMRDIRDYPVMLSADGSFKTEDVLPGKYEFTVHFFNRGEMSFPHTNIAAFTSSQELVVPITADTNSDAPVDCGTVELKPFTLPTFMNVQTNADRSTAR